MLNRFAGTSTFRCRGQITDVNAFGAYTIEINGLRHPRLKTRKISVEWK